MHTYKTNQVSVKENKLCVSVRQVTITIWQHRWCTSTFLISATFGNKGNMYSQHIYEV